VPAEPVCLSCRRPLEPELAGGGLAVDLDGPEALAAARELAAAAPGDQATQAVVRELLAGLCRVCGRALP